MYLSRNIPDFTSSVMSKWAPNIYRVIIENNLADLVHLLEGGADIDVVDIFGQTPLHWACYHLLPAVVDLLLRHNADIDIVDNGGATALRLSLYQPSTSPNRVAVLQVMATCAQTRLEASSADWIRLARNERL